MNKTRTRSKLLGVDIIFSRKVKSSKLKVNLFLDGLEMRQATNLVNLFHDNLHQSKCCWNIIDSITSELLKVSQRTRDVDTGFMANRFSVVEYQFQTCFSVLLALIEI